MFVVSHTPASVRRSGPYAARNPLRPAVAPKFGATAPIRSGGFRAVVAKKMDWIYREVWKELLVTDFVAMVNPRFWIALVKRGADDARETGIREITGMIAMSPMSGWYHSAMLGLSKLFARKKPIDFSAWVDRNAMDDFVELFKETLQNAHSPTEAREKLIDRFVEGLTSTDEHIVSKTRSILSQQPLSGQEAQLSRLLEDVSYSPQQKVAKNRLKARFSLRGTHELGGTVPLDQNVWERLRPKLVEERRRLELLSELSDADRNERLRSFQENLYRKFRLGESAKYTPEPFWLESRQADAIEAGLSDSVNFGERIRGRKRDEILDHFTNFLHQFIDPILVDENGLLSNRGFESEEKKAVLDKLLGPEGLIPYAHKIKHYLLWVPFATALSTAMSFAFINNWITKRKYNGQVFFPGEGVHPAQTNKMSPISNNPNTASPPPPTTVVNHLPGSMARVLPVVVPSAIAISPNSSGRTGYPFSPTASGYTPFLRTPTGVMQPSFGGFASTMMRTFDYPVARMTPLRHAQFIYAVLIMSRCMAALQRSYNEFREHATRDILGALTWFYLSHIWQRVLLAHLMPRLPFVDKDYASTYKPLLVKEVTTPPQGEGLKAKIQRLNWRLHNPLYRLELTSSEQLRERKTQMEDQVWKKLQLQVETRLGPNAAKELVQAETKALFQETRVPLHNLLERAWQYRQIAKFTGFAAVFAVLGIGINLFNIYLTNKNVKAGKVGLNRSVSVPPLREAQYPRPYRNNTFINNTPMPYAPTSAPLPLRQTQAQWG